MIIRILLLLVFFQISPFRVLSDDFFVSVKGSDSDGDGSQTRPWKTLGFACSRIPADHGHTIKLSEGTFIEQRVTVPTGVNIVGAGRDRTIIKADPSFYHHPADPGFSHEKFLIDLSSHSIATGDQSVKDLTIDGDGKKLHGGIIVKNRTKVLLKRISIQSTNFTGIWLWEVKDSRVSEAIVKNCAWGSAGWSSAAIDMTNLERVEFDNIQIDESFGYGMKALGTNGPMHYVKIHDSNISVAPFGKWKTDSGADAPNIAVEFWNVDLLGCEFYNNYVDNIISLIMDKEEWRKPKGSQTIRVYNNVIDLETRAKGYGYALEVSLHDIEIDHNYIFKGTHGIVNWDKGQTLMSNWKIHHNIFYGITDHYPSEIVRAESSGLHDVKFYNNTIEFSGNQTTNLFAVYGGTSDNIEIKNNLIINSNTSYNHYPNEILHVEKGKMTNVVITNNFLSNQPMGSVPGKSEKNKTGDPRLKKVGKRPLPYYLPGTDSPVIDSGVDVGLPFEGTAPDIGAHESFLHH